MNGVHARPNLHGRHSIVNLRSVDLNLLVVFDAIIRERGVTTAAKRLSMTPSAVSHALGRMRVMFNDEIIRRTEHGFEPTPRALELAAQIGEGLKTIEWAIEDQTSFDPLRSRRVLTLYVSDYVGVFLLPTLCERLRREAPNVRLVVERLAINQERTDPGEIQLRVGWMPRPYEYRREQVFADEFSVVMRPDHEAARKPLTLETYVGLSHLKVSPAAVGTAMIDEALAKRGLTRKVMVSIANWSEMARIVERTDLIAAVPRHWAALDPRMAGLVHQPLPLNDVKFTVDQCWHPSHDRDPGHRWFRSLLFEIFKQAEEESMAGALEAGEAPQVAGAVPGRRTRAPAKHLSRAGSAGRR